MIDEDETNNFNRRLIQLKQIITNEVMMYLIFGVLTTVVNLIIFFIFTKIFVSGWLLANIIAFIISVLFAYWTNKLYVFKSNSKDKLVILKEFITFISARLFSLGIEILTLFIMLQLLNLNDVFGKVTAQVIVVVLNYVFSKVFVFRKPK
ncbi:GtrA family protein [Atopobacter phocae]|uniref:GtrA family protein n=1 Tax=Atopobacter phocae TaxID=136492 RepID=UPI000688AA14|nr:GtrA family protein [Atopobacter phocae]